MAAANLNRHSSSSDDSSSDHEGICTAALISFIYLCGFVAEDAQAAKELAALTESAHKALAHIQVRRTLPILDTPSRKCIPDLFHLIDLQILSVHPCMIAN